MKWEKAIKKIEEAIANGKRVEINYHVKYNPKQSYFDTVDSIHEYDYDGQRYKTVITYYDGLDEVRNIIDSVKAF